MAQPKPGVFRNDNTTYVEVRKPASFVGNAWRDEFVGGSVTNGKAVDHCASHSWPSERRNEWIRSDWGQQGFFFLVTYFHNCRNNRGSNLFVNISLNFIAERSGRKSST